MTAAWSPEEIARNVARDIPAGSCVNLGIGMPTLVAREISTGSGIVLTSENGLIGIGPPPEPGADDRDTVDAGKNPVTLIPGAAVVHHADSFALIRGGRLDVAVLGAFEVDEHGNLASWRRPNERLGSVGGAMDIAVGARTKFVMMTHLDRSGHRKVVRDCTFPLTAAACVNRIYTDLAVIDVSSEGLVVRSIHPSLSFAELQQVTDARLHERGVGEPAPR
ncbi:MAG TPA: 3-oxoacid CoA-transferase subunit B [Gemmatimonadaceae bacterium]